MDRTRKKLAKTALPIFEAQQSSGRNQHLQDFDCLCGLGCIFFDSLIFNRKVDSDRFAGGLRKASQPGL